MQSELKYYPLYRATLHELAKLSTCVRVRVSAIIVDHGQILMSSYNGTMPGQPHCQDVNQSFDSSDSWLSNHHAFAVNNEGHAEQNLIAQCAKKGIVTNDKLLCVSFSPCVHCAKSIIMSGISKVLYLQQYDMDAYGIELLEKNDIICESF